MTSLRSSDIDRIARGVIHAHCEHAAKRAVSYAIADTIMAIFGFHRVDKKRRRPRKPNWRARDRFLAPFDKRMRAALKRVWDEERRVILANMKKHPLKGIVEKDSPSPIDNWLYPRTRFQAKLSKEAQAALKPLIGASIERVVEEWGFEVVFDVVNERALGWLASYTPKFSENLEAVNTDLLRSTLTEGIEAGESMRDLRARVMDTFENWEAGQWSRAEMIARTETIRTQEQGNQEVYKEAGFERKVWFANPDACSSTGKPSDAGKTFCADLDNVDIPIDDLFDGEVMGPPLHPNCRCSCGPWEEGW